MSFYIELPVDVQGNRAYTAGFPCVVEGELHRDEHGVHLVFKAPDEIASKWTSVFFDSHGGWMETEGPARRASLEELDQLISEKKKKFDFSVEKIREMTYWQFYQGFIGDHCGTCRKTANVLNGGPGWICICGSYNVQAFHGGMMPHEHPYLGPALATIQEGHGHNENST